MHDLEQWRRWRSRFYLGLVVALMLAIALAGAWNVRRLTMAPPAAPAVPSPAPAGR